MLLHIVKKYWLLVMLIPFGNCTYNSCQTEPGPPTDVFYNLEAINLDIHEQAGLAFTFNGKELDKKDKDFFMSDDLMVYCTHEGKWQATVVGAGGIDSYLQIRAQNTLIKEVHIHTTSDVFPYQDAIGPEWPGIHNIGNTCFANSVYKLIARCVGVDHCLTQDKPHEIHTYLRNIVNGIRLGKRAALHTKVVNGEVSEIFLDQLDIQIKKTTSNLIVYITIFLTNVSSMTLELF